MRLRVARQSGLSFPEPFFWTTADLDRLARSDPDYRKHLHARALDALNATSDKIRIAAEGDSWFDHPCIQDVMDWLKALGYAPYRSDAPGRKLADMLSEKAYLPFLDDPNVRAMLLSGGGNDLISWKRKSEATPSPIFKTGNGSDEPGDYLCESELGGALSAIGRLLEEFARDVRGKRGDLPVIVHCYDRFVPRTTGPHGAWIGPQMDLVGVPVNTRLRSAIAALLIDRANKAYESVCAAHGMTYVDLRGTAQGRWYDEIHPDGAAFGDIARKLAARIPGLRARRVLRRAVRRKKR